MRRRKRHFLIFHLSGIVCGLDFHGFSWNRNRAWAKRCFKSFGKFTFSGKTANSKTRAAKNMNFWKLSKNERIKIMDGKYDFPFKPYANLLLYRFKLFSIPDLALENIYKVFGRPRAL